MTGPHVNAQDVTVLPVRGNLRGEIRLAALGWRARGQSVGLAAAVNRIPLM